MAHKRGRNISTSEEVKRNASRIVKALLCLGDEKLELSERVEVEWDASGTKLKVTGRCQKQNRRGFTTIKATTLLELVQLVERSGDRIEPIKPKRDFNRREEQKQVEAVRNAIHFLKASKVLKDDRGNRLKNTPYWIFTLMLKHQTAGWEENLRYLESICDRNSPSGQPEPTQYTSGLEQRLNIAAGLTEKPISSENAEDLPPQCYSLLFDLLIRIDFIQQRQVVRQVLEIHQTAGFLVYGDFYCGQQFLLNRLFRLKQGWKNQSPIKIDVSANGLGRRIPNLWGRLGDWFELPRDAKASEVLEKICDRLLEQDAIFIFNSVDYMLPGGLLGLWLEDFWVPLVKMVERLPKRETHLLMFLVDNCGRVGQSNLRLAEKIEHPEYPYLPLRLPPACKFPLEALEDWFDDVREYRDFQTPTNLTPQELLEKSDNGIPQFVYEEICQQYGVSLEGGIARWLI